ncbi:antibiotic biosynthesis monooxygenase [Mycoplasma anserisalpingitidis]|uniref:antibiotic biosynthesis monooxygenase n=1 Tax=Mycoplasma anserisalpingitidis TaxID=519450 RepID=UPI0011B18220|nr:antibiotic biosynthesis monooxygenase [Mycoplasma anserisalpingitidis]QDY87622.1 antibiotic biosynthesis monooxygenase [Mycoplasma anserisalpingitidis]UCU26666.1 antibiotic biosynthesis monooxygenase [Mycoplasma anserisalpingitidis]UCU27504.1 antibiotic biosynthesis monooxygenase [Mycoplasma anserisalpingitidis]
MIYSKATKYIVKEEKLKGFVDYLYVFVKKARMETQNLSFEYGLNQTKEIIVLERWSTQNDSENFEKKEEIKKELDTLAKMATKTELIYSLDTIR